MPKDIPGFTYSVEAAFGDQSHFSMPLCIASPPAEKDRFVVLEKGGRAFLVTRLDGKFTRSLFFDMRAILAANHNGVLATNLEWGLLGIAFHPDFEANGFVYVAYDFTMDEAGRRRSFNRLSRFTVSKAEPRHVEPASEVPMITQLDLADNHNAGDLHFGPEGYLYYSMGDEGGANDSFNNARFIDKDFFAAIYRLDVDRKPGNLEPNPHRQDSTKFPSAVHPGTYKVPADNPFIKAASFNGKKLIPENIRTEVWATGFRNPWRFSIDKATGRVFAGDVGESRWEEIDIVKGGEFYGWPYWEGTHRGPKLRTLPPDAKAVPPIYEYPHGIGSVFDGSCVIGGVISHSPRLPELDGAYVFGDYVTHAIWSLREAGNKWIPSLLERTPGGAAAFGIDPQNNDILVVDYGDGTIERLVRSTSTQAAEPPARLSETGVFKNLATLEPSTGFVAYTPNVESWSGPVLARRWVALTGTVPMGYVRNGNWTFPAGTVWVQHLDANIGPGATTPGRKIETRLLVKTENACYCLDYKWRPDQTDADLVSESGSDEPSSLHGDAGWRSPGRAECLACHTAAAGYALGFNTAQLNPLYLRHFIDTGLVSAAEKEVRGELPAFARPDDKTQSLEWRVRSYLAVNCAQCHQPGGAGGGTWDARYMTPTSRANIVNGNLVNTMGDAANRFVVPGDPAHSMLLTRLMGKTAPRMPLVGPSQVDPEAIRLITEWINAGAHTR